MIVFAKSKLWLLLPFSVLQILLIATWRPWGGYGAIAWNLFIVAMTLVEANLCLSPAVVVRGRTVYLIGSLSMRRLGLVEVDAIEMVRGGSFMSSRTLGFRCAGRTYEASRLLVFGRERELELLGQDLDRLRKSGDSVSSGLRLICPISGPVGARGLVGRPAFIDRWRTMGSDSASAALADGGQMGLMLGFKESVD